MSTPEREYRTCLELGLPDTYSPAKMGLIIQGISNALVEINDKVEGNTSNRPTVNDGVLTLTDSAGNIIGTFSANQAANVALSLPAGFSGEWLDLIGKPDVNDAALVIKDSTGTVLATFTANADTDVSFNLPEGFSGEWNDITNKPDVFPPDNDLIDIALDDLNDVSAAGNEGDYLVKLANGNHGFTALPTPPSLNPLGYIDVSEPAPANPQVGDYYQQHRDDLGDAVASANFNGIVGETAVEGQAVLYGADNQWHLGTSGTPAQKQADYAQTDVKEVDYIKNKPVIGDGSIQVNAGSGLIASGDNATANQAGNTIRTISLNSGNGLTINSGDNSVEIDLNYLEQELDMFPEAPADGNVYVRNGSTGQWERGIPYDITTLPTLP